MPRKFIYVTITKRYLLAFTLLALALFGLSLPNTYHLAVMTAAIVTTTAEYDIVLDAGHGGVDSGGVGADAVYEKDITLDIVLRLRDILENAGLKVGLTRDSDTDVTHLADQGKTRHQRDLLGRYKILHSGKLGMSVHINTAKDTEQKGAIVFYMRNAYIDRQYAQTVFDELERVQTMNHTFIVPRSNLMVLKAKPPVIMIEVGFLTNETDLQKLTDPQFRQSIAEALATGILKYWSLYQLEQTE